MTIEISRFDDLSHPLGCSYGHEHAIRFKFMPNIVSSDQLGDEPTAAKRVYTIHQHLAHPEVRIKPLTLSRND